MPCSISLHSGDDCPYLFAPGGTVARHGVNSYDSDRKNALLLLINWDKLFGASSKLVGAEQLCPGHRLW